MVDDKSLYGVQIIETRKDWVVVEADDAEEAARIAEVLYDEHLLDPGVESEDDVELKVEESPVLSGAYLLASMNENGEVTCKLVNSEE